MPSSARHRQPAIPDLAYRGGSRVLAADQPQWLSVIGMLTCRVPAEYLRLTLWLRRHRTCAHTFQFWRGSTNQMTDNLIGRTVVGHSLSKEPIYPALSRRGATRWANSDTYLAHQSTQGHLTARRRACHWHGGQRRNAVSIPGHTRAAVSGCGRDGVERRPWRAREGGGDGVEGGDAVGGGGVEVAAVAAPAGEGCLGLPVPGDGLVLLGGLGVLLGDVVRPLHGGWLVNSRTCLA
jgi:hypothetical protein